MEMKKTCFALFALCAAMASATVPNPLAFWKMDKVEDGKILDESGNGHDLTLGADCYLTNGLLGGKALYLTGSEGSYGTFSCPALKSRTLSFWMCREKTDGPLGASTNSMPYLFSHWSGFNVHWGFGESGFIPMMFGRTASAYFGATNVTRRVWNHYAITLEDTGETNGDGDPVCHYVMYLDGAEYVRQENVQLAGPFYSSAVVCHLGNIPSFTRGVNAFIDELRLHDSALSAAHVKELFDEEDKRFPKRMIGRWPMERIDVDGGVRTTPDISGTGTAMLLGPGVYVTNGINGANALFFAGGKQADGVYAWGAATNNQPGVTDFTISCWVKRDPAMDTENGARLWARGSIWVNLGNPAANTSGNYLQVIASKASGGTMSLITSGAVRQANEWSHIAYTVTYARDAETGNYTLTPRAYMNGEYAGGGTSLADLCPPSIAETPEGTQIIFCNSGKDVARAIRSAVWDYRLYAKALSAEEVRALYRGAAEVDAGADFTTTAGTVMLRGTVGDSSAGAGIRQGYAGFVGWELVSVPAGGEGAGIESPEGAVTRVTLPVTGAYTFRLKTETTLGDVSDDEVTVTRAASSAITQPPAVGVAAETPQPGDFAVALTATVSDPAGAATRISWKGVSGPGGVWFRPAGAKTLAMFSAAGTYVLRCTVENGEKAASADVTVTVDTAATTAGVTNGLLAYWPVDDAYTDKVSGGYAVAEGVSDVAMRRDPGLSGYAIKTTGFKAYAKASCGIVNDAANGESGAGTLVTNEYYRTFSMWLYHDGADTNATKAAALVHVKYNFGIWYNCEDGGTDFTLYQVGRYGSPISQLRFAGPGTNFTNRWVHVVAQVGRKAGMTSEVWVDGVKLGEKSGALTTGRALGNTDTLCIGGFSYAETPDQAPASLNNGTGYYVDGEGNLLSRHFPGVIDEIRVYGRRLSPNEIAYLGAVPFHGNFAPAVGGGDFRVAAYRATTLAALAGDDGLPAGSALAYKWDVVSGDAAKISIADPSAVATLVTARKPGDYVLRLAVSDGERTTYGEPVVFSAFASGTTFFVN